MCIDEIRKGTSVTESLVALGRKARGRTNNFQLKLLPRPPHASQFSMFSIKYDAQEMPYLDSMQNATLWTLINALQAHLIPTPLLNTLPTALQIFAHFQLVGERIKLEAARALEEHHETLKSMDDRAIRLQDQVAMGALNEKDGRRLNKLAKRDEEETMFAFSMEFRKHVCSLLLVQVFQSSR